MNIGIEGPDQTGGSPDQSACGQDLLLFTISTAIL